MTTTTTTSPRARRRARSAPGSPGRSSSALISTVLIYVFREPIADVLLGDPEDENLVALAGLLAGALLVFKICDIVLWLERRPTAFLIADSSRPILGLIVLVDLPRDRLRGRGSDDRHA